MLALILIYAILFLVLACPATILIYTPWRIAWRMWLILAITAISYSDLTYIEHWENDNFDFIFYLYFFGVMGFVLIFRGLYRKFLKKLAPLEPSKPILILDHLTTVYFGFILSLFIIRFFAYYFAQQDNGFLIHETITVAGIIVTILSFSLVFFKTKTIVRHLALLFMTASSLVSVGSFMGMNYPDIVLADAAAKADSKPYCIDLGRQRREVTSREDLTLFTMDKKGGDRHAALIIQNDDGELVPYTWSYWQKKFLKGLNNWGNHNQPSLFCKPKLNFADDLSEKTSGMPEYVHLYFQNKYLEIPSKFSPSSWTKSLSISTVSPDFKAVPREKFKLYPSIEVRDNSFLINSAKDYMHGRKDEFIGSWEDFKNLNNDYKKYLKFSIHTAENKIITFIRCFEEKDGSRSCQHRFYRDGKMYSFNHDANFLPQSQDMEDRLYDLFKSFGL